MVIELQFDGATCIVHLPAAPASHGRAVAARACGGGGDNSWKAPAAAELESLHLLHKGAAGLPAQAPGHLGAEVRAPPRHLHFSKLEQLALLADQVGSAGRLPPGRRSAPPHRPAAWLPPARATDRLKCAQAYDGLRRGTKKTAKLNHGAELNDAVSVRCSYSAIARVTIFSRREGKHAPIPPPAPRCLFAPLEFALLTDAISTLRLSSPANHLASGCVSSRTRIPSQAAAGDP